VASFGESSEADHVTETGGGRTEYYSSRDVWNEERSENDMRNIKIVLFKRIIMWIKVSCKTYVGNMLLIVEMTKC
jgi:hypothetical protein